MTTLNRDLFVQDPQSFSLPNAGVAKLVTPSESAQWEVLHHELRTFVCEGEYAAGLDKILTSYLGKLGKGTQPAVWVSGFYGSGKSHLVRMLQHLWTNTTFPEGATARGIRQLPEIVQRQLVELDTRAKQFGTRAWAAAGTFDSVSVDDVNSAVLKVMLRSAGLPEHIPALRVLLWLRSEGLEHGVRVRLESQGKNFDKALQTFRLSPELRSAILNENPNYADSMGELKDSLMSIAGDDSGLDVHQTIELMGEVMAIVGNGTVPLTLLVLDEIQLYIHDDAHRAQAVSLIAEAITTNFDGKVLLIGTGQSELSATATLQKIRDRFPVTVLLKNQDIDQVVRQVVLAKKPGAAELLQPHLDSGEITRQLAGSKLKHTDADDADLVGDFPVLPSRRRFFEEVLRQADAGTRGGQLRSQLRVFEAASKASAQLPLGEVIGADFLYDDKHDDMMSADKLLRETRDLIKDQGDSLRGRILKVLQLIGLLPRTPTADRGVRGTVEHLIDLLVTDLGNGRAKLGKQVPETLQSLLDDGAIQFDGTEYRLQTQEGKDWDQKVKAARTDVELPELQGEVDRSLADLVAKQVPKRVAQGTQQRPVRIARSSAMPALGEEIVLWQRTGWDGDTEAAALTAAGSAGSESALVVLFVPADQAEHVHIAAREFLATKQVLDTSASPSTEEGRQAKRAIESKNATARGSLDSMLGQALRDASVVLAGGAPGQGSTTGARIADALARAAARLYPQYPVSTKVEWKKIVARAAAGNNDPSDGVLRAAVPQQDPVVKQIFTGIGANPTDVKTILSRFAVPPFGWDTDTVAGALVTLLSKGVITAESNSLPADLRKFATSSPRFAQVTVRSESVILSVQQKLSARSLLTKLGQPGSEEATAERCQAAVHALRSRVADLCGEPPYPQLSLPPALDAVTKATGNAAVQSLLTAEGSIVAELKQVVAMEQRRPSREASLRNSRALGIALVDREEAHSAISELTEFCNARTLLQEVDGIAPIEQQLATVARIAVNESSHAHGVALEAALSSFPPSGAETLTNADRERLIARHRLTPIVVGPLGSPAEVVAELARRPLVAWAAEIDAVPGRLRQAQQAALTLVQPTAHAVGLPGATITSPSELAAYLDTVSVRLNDEFAAHALIVVRAS
ncbi:hypothetical protein ABIB25_005577 [Nakamurella sp. UYEF19]|uniref:BREX system P-loop protein BrxC n=1 Tax=Nakamurella sp. UYEF19 TaxID=1756392 RepID=UPI0033960503